MSVQKPKVVMIGNSHIDPVWLWREDEGLQEVRSTFISVLQRMEEFPEFQFTASSAAFYAWLKDIHPDLFEKIQQKVTEGRWHLAGGWWVEPDLNIPLGESLVRQGLYAQRFFLEHFGRLARVGFNVDSFGHSGALPGILAGQGIKGYVFMRPQPHQMPLSEELFSWEDAGGSSVTACRISGEYCAWTKPSILLNLEKTLLSLGRQEISCLPCYYGVGNHGGGPTIENIKAIREIAQERSDLHITHDSLEECLAQWQGLTLPVLNGSLEGCFPGCYSADSEIKQLNREAEEALIRAETLCSMAMGNGFCYPAEPLRKAWQLLLFQQFHDTLAGTARKEARDEAAVNFQACLSAARAAGRDATQSISMMVDTRGEGIPLLLINPCSERFEGVVDADISWRAKFPLRVKDSSGLELVYDESPRSLVAPDARKHLVFRASVPPFGYAVYRMLQEKPLLKGKMMDCARERLENGLLRADFNLVSGLASLCLKESELQILKSSVSIAVYEDKRDTWGAEGEIGKPLGEYQVTSLSLIENGSVRSSVLMEFIFEDSRAEMTVELGREDSFLSFHGFLDNREKHVLTALRIPLSFLPRSIIAEIPYGEEQRPDQDGAEAACQRYCDIQGEGISLLIINKAKYAYRIKDGVFELILSRSPIHAFSAGQQPEEGCVYEYIDQGRMPFAVQLHPRLGIFSGLERQLTAQRFHRALSLLACDSHEGACALREQTLVHMEGASGVLLHGMKKAEDGGTVLRLQNTLGTPVSGSVAFGGVGAPYFLGAYALGTIVLNPEGRSGMTDLLEFFLEDGDKGQDVK